jgi:hypothetical protein
MTTTRVHLRCKSQHCDPVQRTFCQAEAPTTLDPAMEDKQMLLLRCALFDGEHGKAHLDRASIFWAGIHWYREPHNWR